MLYTLLSWYFLFERRLDTGRQYLIKATDVVTLNDLRFSSQTMDAMIALEEPDEDTKEYLTALSQRLYMDRAATIVLGMAPLMNLEYDKQFKALSVS